jgi:hypothetical protein
MNCFAVGETNTYNFLSRRRKTPSIIFIHIKAFFIKDEAPPYTMKFSLRRSIFVFNKAFCLHKEASFFFSVNDCASCHDDDDDDSTNI